MRVMGDKSGGSTEKDSVTGVWRGEWEIVWDEADGEKWSSVQRQGDAYRKEQSFIHNNDNIAGQVRMIRDEEWVLWGGWTEMRLCRYEGWTVKDFASKWQAFS